MAKRSFPFVEPTNLPFHAHRNVLLAAATALFCTTVCTYAYAESTNETAVRLLEGARASIHCYDVMVRCVEHLLLKDLEPRVVEGRGGQKITVPNVEVVPWDKAKIRESRFRQVFSDQGKYPVPLRRVEELRGTSMESRSILAFDGTVRRSLYNDTKHGLVAAPPDEKHEFLEFGYDYLTIAGVRVPGKYLVLSDLALKLPSDKIEIEQLDDRVFLHLRPSKPENATRDGYRIWFDRSHGMLLRELHQYAFTPHPTLGWDDRVGIEIIVHDYTALEGGGWAPISATVKTFFDRGKDVGALFSQTELTVDASRSSWNVEPTPDAFTFDFPVGTRVTDSLRSVAFVVGEKDAGRNLDELIAKAMEMIPTGEEGRKLAGWDVPKSPPGGYMGPALTRALICLNVAGLVALASLLIWRRLRPPPLAGDVQPAER